MHSPIETEIKIYIDSNSNFSSTLINAGYRISKERIFEANTIFDLPSNELLGSEKLLRIRQVGEQGLLTWKRRDGNETADSAHKQRVEIETAVERPRELAYIFLELGFKPVFRYEKYRTEFERNGPGVVTLDETPIGHFLEFEGPGEWIDQAASELGFSPDSYEVRSYGELYQDFCRLENKPPGDMVFGSNAQR